MVYVHNGTLHSYENEWTTTTGNNLDEFYKHNVEWKKLTTKEYYYRISFLKKIYCYSITVVCLFIIIFTEKNFKKGKTNLYS